MSKLFFNVYLLPSIVEHPHLSHPGLNSCEIQLVMRGVERLRVVNGDFLLLQLFDVAFNARGMIAD